MILIYVYKKTAYIPTLYLVEPGHYKQLQPVDVVALDNFELLCLSIKRAIEKGNPKFSLNDIDPKTAQPFVKGISWRSFGRNADCWEVVEKDGSFQIKQQAKTESGGFVDSNLPDEFLKSNTGIDGIVSQIATKIQSTNKVIN